MIILSERESPFALALLRGLTNITLKQINHSKFYLAFPCKFHDMRRIPAGQNGKETDGQVVKSIGRFPVNKTDKN